MHYSLSLSLFFIITIIIILIMFIIIFIFIIIIIVIVIIIIIIIIIVITTAATTTDLFYYNCLLLIWLSYPMILPWQKDDQLINPKNPNWLPIPASAHLSGFEILGARICGAAARGPRKPGEIGGW